MATTLLEPGGDATFNVASLTAGGMWYGVGNSPTVVTDFVHGTHQRSIKFAAGSNQFVASRNGVFADAGSRLSFWYYNVANPNATASICLIQDFDGANTVFSLRLTSAGVIQIWNGQSTGQIGTDGATISTGRWTRISLAYTITSTTINRFELFVDGTSSISITNATLTRTGTTLWNPGNAETNATLDMRWSDLYVDDSSSLTDPGEIWVTAKRPFANGTANNFTTQIGAGGSGYGTGHAPQVNERALSTTNGWSMVGAGSAVTEEYTIEGASVGDIDITNFEIVDYGGWLYQGSLVSETATMVTGGSSSTYATGTSANMITSFRGSTTYPAGGTDIGMITSTDLTTVSLYECGIMVAYIPSVPLADGFAILREDGGQVLVETNDVLLLESGDAATTTETIPTLLTMGVGI